MDQMGKRYGSEQKKRQDDVKLKHERNHVHQPVLRIKGEQAAKPRPDGRTVFIGHHSRIIHEGHIGTDGCDDQD